MEYSCQESLRKLRKQKLNGRPNKVIFYKNPDDGRTIEQKTHPDILQEIF